MVNAGLPDEGSSDDANTPPRSQNTSREEDDSSNANESDCKSPNQRYALTKSNQRWMKLRTTVQISSAIQKKPPLKREDSFLKRFSSRQIPETQETVEDTGSEGQPGDSQSAPRRRRRLRKQPKSVVNPDSNFYFYWLLVITGGVLYNMWTLIVRQSFPELQNMISTFWISCDSISDLVFLLDVVVQLRTGHLEQGLMVYDSKKLACHYLRSRAFLLDLAALCPLDLLQFRFGSQPLLRCPRFLKVYRAVNYYYMVESRTIWPNLWRVVNLIHILLILAHWFGCFYFLLSEAEGFQGDWVYPYRPGDYATLTRKYLGSLYWSTLTLTTIGDLPTPETNAEKTNSVDGPRSLPRRGVKSRLLQFNTNFGYVFTIVSYLIGVFIFATIVGQVGNVITNRNANRLEFERLLDGAKTYMRHHKVPGGMKRRVLRWYDYSWSRGRIQGGGDINTALGLLPDKLKTELALHVNLTVLKKVTIFQECQPEFLRDLVLKMKAYIFTPGDSICRKGEVAREMFIIADGILEVLSEHGKVLTTMKAGDFFGEIGILNLDGLNKRTADVRSVGYSELFSLSREDVLNAMKDYPEAQEILQALGRKRLMEVKASARQHAHHEKHGHHGHGHDKGLVDKIKSEAKGLRNVLKKTKTHRRTSQESLELQPLHSSSNNTKGTLKRMSRVKSHDLSQEEIEKKEEKPEVMTSPLGAGLPLLQRLRLLKEKQENEDRSKHASPIISPTIKSPPSIQEEPSEPLGAGLPLLQRILMLKAKEEKAAKAAKTGVGGMMVKSSCQLINSQINVRSAPPPSTTQPQPTSPTSKAAIISTTKIQMPAKLINNKISLRERLKLATGIPTRQPEKDSLLKDTIDSGSLETELKQVIVEPSNQLSPALVTNATEPTRLLLDDTRIAREPTANIEEATTSSSNQSKSETVDNSDRLHESSDNVKPIEKSDSNRSSRLSSDSSIDKAAHWSKLKKAAISKDIAEPGEHLDEEDAREVPRVVGKIKPSLVLTRKTKQYRSIDDLSPEYGPLPFVKKLKILNERQKLEELETVIKTRSFSLDIPDNASFDNDTLTRSQSEGSTMHQDENFLSAPLQSPLHSSNESNETLERRNLKSILKKLSEDTKEDPVSVMPEKKDSTEFKKLMRAPTIEGYAARHSKLSKSVTFNRDTLQSPPNSANLMTQGTPQSLFPFVNSPVEMIRDQDKRAELERYLPNKTNNQVKLLKGSLDDEQQYFADILLAIKQVMSAHFQDLQDKFQQRFDKLEQDCRHKDEIISQLKAHISELERNNDDSFTDSYDTIISKDKSWDEPSQEEMGEIQELPQHPLQPHHVWQSSQQDSEGHITHNVILDIDSTTEDESENEVDTDEKDLFFNERNREADSETDQNESENEYENTSNNWEIELLAAQMRERRSASLDHNSTGKCFIHKVKKMCSGRQK
ncbi:unnamed protein product, partial [Brassicogethes aeneus]